MKFNQWTFGLAAVGVVSLASVASAEEKMSAVQALTPTTISGYVNTSAQWNPGTGNANLPAYKFNTGKADGFNLDVVKLTVEKALDEAQWAAGYKVDLLFGPDATIYNTSSKLLGTGTTSDFAIKQAYVALQTPILPNGLTFKMGVFDSIIGYESFDAGSNPNYTRSYGHTLEPQTHTGVLAMYRLTDNVQVAAGVADTFGPSINQRANPPKAESYKTYMGSITITAPESMGVLGGSALYAGVVNGFSTLLVNHDQTSWYAGATLKTPVTGLRVGASYDYLGVSQQPLLPANTTVWVNSLAGYASYQATEKLSLHARGEYLWRTDFAGFAKGQVGGFPASKVLALTGTLQYDLWQNVISRLEVRWDHAANGTKVFGGTSSPTRKNALLLAANVIYKF
jgi:hypothetical protein